MPMTYRGAVEKLREAELLHLVPPDANFVAPHWQSALIVGSGGGAFLVILYDQFSVGGPSRTSSDGNSLVMYFSNVHVAGDWFEKAKARIQSGSAPWW